MESLDKLRISKLKCSSCGARDKRVALLESTIIPSKRIGFSTICCNCGGIQNYLFKDKETLDKEEKETMNLNIGKWISNSNIKLFMNHEYKMTCLMCVIPEPFCLNKQCPLRHNKPDRDINYEDIENGLCFCDCEKIVIKEKEEKKRYL